MVASRAARVSAVVDRVRLCAEANLSSWGMAFGSKRDDSGKGGGNGKSVVASEEGYDVCAKLEGWNKGNMSTGATVL